MFIAPDLLLLAHSVGVTCLIVRFQLFKRTCHSYGVLAARTARFYKHRTPTEFAIGAVTQ